MYMRYAGGGVGHYRVALTDTPANPNETQEVSAVDDDIIVAEVAGLEEVEEAEGIQDDNIEDRCSDSEGREEDEDNLEEDDHGTEDGEEEEDEDNPEEDDLGAEDGEERFLDAEDEEGYAAL
jgi:hypothetical protein